MSETTIETTTKAEAGLSAGRTVPQLEEAYSAKAVELMNTHAARTAEIARLRAPEGDPLLLEHLCWERLVLAELVED